MIKTFRSNLITFEYSLKKSLAQKSMRITINNLGKITLTTNSLTPQFMIDQFLYSNIDWVQSRLNQASIAPSLKVLKSQFIRLKPIARKLITQRLSYFNQIYNYKIGNITIRDQSSRWGSCTKDGNLSFNYRLALLPKELADLVIVHELCHIGELNHSPRFWALVRKTIPNYRTLRLKLNQLDMNSLHI